MPKASRRPAHRSLRGWAIAVLLGTETIRECEHHGYMRERGDPHARQRALEIARHHPPIGHSASEAVAAIEDVLHATGDTCPGC